MRVIGFSDQCHKNKIATIVQQEEHVIGNDEVGSSILPRGLN